MRTGAWFVAAVLCTSAGAQNLERPDFCATNAELSSRVLRYQQCIAFYAKKFEVSGDAAESVATASVGACGELRQPIADYFDQCGRSPGNEIVKDTDQKFHDFAVLAVIRYRTERMTKKSK
jgi:hypothetical protein